MQSTDSPSEAPPEDDLPTSPKDPVSVESELTHIGIGRFQYVALCILGLANASDAVELLCLSFILPLLEDGTSSKCSETPEDIGKNSGGNYTPELKALLSAGIFIGMLVGGLVFGVGADYLGRRRTLSLSLFINAFFGLLSSITSNFPFLFLCRVLSGFGVGGSIPGVFTMAAEILPEKGRAFWLSTVAWWWMVGSIYAAGLAWLLLGVFCVHWKVYAALCTIPAGAACALTLLLPESPKYLHGKGDARGAAASLIIIASWSGRTSRLSQGWTLDPTLDDTDDDSSGEETASSELSDEEVGGLGIKIEKIDHSSVADSASKISTGMKEVSAADTESVGLLLFERKVAEHTKSDSKAVSFKRGANKSTLKVICVPLMRMFHKRHLRTTLLLSTVWFTLSFGWYGLISWLPTLIKQIGLDEYEDSFIATAANLPGNLLSAVLMDYLTNGRKLVLVYSLVAACLFVLAFRFSVDKGEAAILAAVCCINAVSTCSWNSLDCLSTESFPTGLRTSAMGFLAAQGRLGSIAGQFVFGSLVDEKGGRDLLLILSSTVLAVGAAAAIFLPTFHFKD